jgi:hypothetical protein
MRISEMLLLQWLLMLLQPCSSASPVFERRVPSQLTEL